ncbi:2-oxoadipate dioxygenase/decarboxylase, chloroplastic/amyloplastic [Orobanche hederae]
MNTMLRFSSSVESCIFPLLSSLPSSSTSSSSSSGFVSGSPKNFISLKDGITSGDFNFLGRRTRHFSAMSASNDHIGYPQDCSFRGGESFFRNILATIETVYLNRNPTAKSILELVRSVDGDCICYDHFAFRTFGVNGHGIDSMAKLFLDFGYVQREELRFPSKKLKAFWFSPPKVPRIADGGSGVNGPLPRIFISELLVDEMSPEAQKIIRKYTEILGNGNMHAALASALGCLTWDKPSYSEFQQLARESEYAAWTLVNGYTLNHVTVSAHRLKSHLRNIRDLNLFIEENGFKLNSEGGVLKVSPDGLLLQSSTVADSTSFQFAQGIVESIPCSYIEFAERLVLPQFKNLPENKVDEFHRRDGFEVANADKIFESTSKDQLTRKLA